MHLFRAHLCLLLILCSLASLVHAADFHAKVVHVTDGDTITVLNDTNNQIKIRLNGIDCPEKAQAYGNKAKEFTKDLVAGKMVTIKTYKIGIYGGKVAPRAI
jgi:micrococcal nuclease